MSWALFEVGYAEEPPACVALISVFRLTLAVPLLMWDLRLAVPLFFPFCFSS